VTAGRSEAAAIPEEVRILLHDRIASFEQLLVLLLLHRSNPKRWSTQTIADHLGIPSGLPEALKALQTAGLVSEKIEGSESMYVYAPGTPDIARTVSDLQQSYQSHSAAIMQLMSENAIARVRRAAYRTFSDAFLIRKGKDRG
jgi:hypothetical protein